MNLGGFILALSLLGLAYPSHASAEEDLELSSDLIHADVPLWGLEHEDIWPQHFSTNEPEFSFGCTSRVAFGDWALMSTEPDFDDEWVRLSNYGVFHCALIHSRDSDRERLDKARFEYGFVVRIGEIKVRDHKLELWALQIGTRTGSDYTLLSREPADGVVKQFTVLQRKCPKARMRRGPSLDQWRTEYCAISSKTEMIAFAKAMARLPALATMRLVEDQAPATEEGADAD